MSRFLLAAALLTSLALVAPPDLHADVTPTLRISYQCAVSSNDYIAEANKRGFDAGHPNRGEEIADYIGKSLSDIPADVVAEFRSYGQ